MKVKRHGPSPRAEWLDVSDERGKVELSMLSCRSEICVDIILDGKREVEYLTPRAIAEALWPLLQPKGEK